MTSTSPRCSTRPLCHFYVRRGSCRKSDSCRFSHDLAGLSRKEALNTIPCPYFQKGTCRYGDDCELQHDISAVAASHPRDSECCGICLEPTTKFGLLSCCNHIFCFQCIMEWRTEGSDEVISRRFCPTCRQQSDYVVPSTFMPNSKEEKEQLLCTYKDRLSKIPCNKWNGELGSCPFGKDCFYQHLDHCGTDIKSHDKTMHQLYEQRQRQRVDRSDMEGFELDIISQMIMLGMQEQLFGVGFGGFVTRGGEQGNENFTDHFVHHMFSQFMSEHMRLLEIRSDSDLESDIDNSSIRELENAPVINLSGDATPSPLPDMIQQEQDVSDHEDSNSEFCDKEDDNESSLPELKEMPPKQHRENASEKFDSL